MPYQQDWLLRQIEMLIQFVSRMLFQKDTVTYEPGEGLSTPEADLLHRRLLELLEQGRYGAAEDLLFDEFQPQDTNYVRLALDFYQRLAGLDDRRLEAGGFSREEIDEGLRALLGRCGIDLSGL